MSTIEQRASLRQALEAFLDDRGTWADVAAVIVELRADEDPKGTARLPYLIHYLQDAESRRAYWASRSAPRPTRDCVHCAGSFRVHRSDARYCSARCRVAAKRLRDQGPVSL